MRCLENRGWRLRIIILIWSRSECLSIICNIFSLQWDMNEVTDSSGLCLRVSNSLCDTSTTMLKEYCLRNSCAKSLQVLRREKSSEANQRCAAPLSDRGNNIIIYASFSLCPSITMLYNYRWIRGHPIPMYLLISGVQNSVGNATTGKLSYPSQLITPSETCNNLILNSILSMRAWVSSITCVGAIIECGVVSICPCKTNAPAYRASWTGGGGSGGTTWSCCMEWPDGGSGGILESCGVLPEAVLARPGAYQSSVPILK